MKSFVRELVPRGVAGWVQRRRADAVWSGAYPSWAEAEAACDGYSQPGILERVKAASRQVRDGRAAFERDSVTFDRAEYVWPLLSILLSIAAEQGGALRVADFGGALGSTYMQHRAWFDRIERVHWGVIEQPHFVEAGRAEFESDRLRFYSTVDDCVSHGGADVVLFSSVLQYLPDPWGILRETAAHRPSAIVIDRTGFVQRGGERIAVQRVPKAIYDASYACRFFVQADVERALAGYRLAASFPSIDRATSFAEFRGLYFRRCGQP